jgi:DNA helicase-2/ATP-dependent DNA helicase PcrA
MGVAPHLQGDAQAAVEHRGSHVQIIAAAGSGKTEVVSQRVVALLAEGVPADTIVAFTFTERAAEELKHRISLRVEERLGVHALDQLNGLFVGTIHAYCFRLLQQHVPRFETYDVLDDNRLTAFLAREAKQLELRQLDARNRLFASIAMFLQNVEVIENELLDPGAMPEPFGSIAVAYFSALDRYRLLTYGQQVVRTVEELESGPLGELVHRSLRHLIVDEYQDVNPAQERLIELLAGPAVELCVVGDDDQAIYQWRGSEVANIVGFTDRYPDVATFEITTNRRSRPTIIETANAFAQSIEGRLDKQMGTFRPASDGGPEVVTWLAESELEEAGWIADLILRLNEDGVSFRDIAVLVRGRASYPRLVEQFATFGIPVQPAGRSGLFDQPEAQVLGQTFAWLADIEWRPPFQPGEAVDLEHLLDAFQARFVVDAAGRNRLRRILREWRSVISRSDRPANLVGEVYELFDALAVRLLDLDDPLQANRLGTLARFTSLLADYESVRRRARVDAAAAGEQVGGQDRGDWYYKNLAIHIVNYAQGAYEGFDGEPDYALDAVDLTTVHRAKGLEWPVVFVPSMTKNRFPSSRTGKAQDWLVPRHLFAAHRYEGTDADERRLFYVAMTRARDWLSVSRHEKVTTRRTAPSPYLDLLPPPALSPDLIEFADIEPVRAGSDEPVTITYSELQSFLDCGLAFRLRNVLGFEPRLATELGYGRAVHHVLRAVAERTKDQGAVPGTAELDEILDQSFFLPTANKPAHRQLKAAARRLVDSYTAAHAEDLFRVWETERPFELHLDGVIVTGRADVILDEEEGVPTALAILDYKTSTSGDRSDHDLQLQIYSDAGRREGLDVRAGYVHDLKAGRRNDVDVSAGAIAGAEATVAGAAARLRARDYQPTPGAQCRRCEVRTVCPAAIR